MIAGVAMCWLAFGTGSSGACCVCVSAVAVACLLLSVCFVGSTTKLVGVGVVIGVESMMSIICLLYLSGFVCLLSLL